MQNMKEHDLFTRPDAPAERSLTLVTHPKRSTRGMRTAAIVALTVLLMVVFGIGLFAGWDRKSLP